MRANEGEVWTWCCLNPDAVVYQKRFAVSLVKLSFLKKGCEKSVLAGLL